MPTGIPTGIPTGSTTDIWRNPHQSDFTATGGVGGGAGSTEYRSITEGMEEDERHEDVEEMKRMSKEVEAAREKARMMAEEEEAEAKKAAMLAEDARKSRLETARRDAAAMRIQARHRGGKGRERALAEREERRRRQCIVVKEEVRRIMEDRAWERRCADEMDAFRSMVERQYGGNVANEEASSFYEHRGDTPTKGDEDTKKKQGQEKKQVVCRQGTAYDFLTLGPCDCQKCMALEKPNEEMSERASRAIEARQSAMMKMMEDSEAGHRRSLPGPKKHRSTKENNNEIDNETNNETNEKTDQMKRTKGSNASGDENKLDNTIESKADDLNLESKQHEAKAGKPKNDEANRSKAVKTEPSSPLNEINQRDTALEMRLSRIEGALFGLRQKELEAEGVHDTRLTRIEAGVEALLFSGEAASKNASKTQGVERSLPDDTCTSLPKPSNIKKFPNVEEWRAKQFRKIPEKPHTPVPPPGHRRGGLLIRDPHVSQTPSRDLFSDTPPSRNTNMNGKIGETRKRMLIPEKKKRNVISSDDLLYSYVTYNPERPRDIRIDEEFSENAKSNAAALTRQQQPRGNAFNRLPMHSPQGYLGDFFAKEPQPSERRWSGMQDDVESLGAEAVMRLFELQPLPYLTPGAHISPKEPTPRKPFGTRTGVSRPSSTLRKSLYDPLPSVPPTPTSVSLRSTSRSLSRSPGGRAPR